MKLRANILVLDVHDCEMEVSYNLSGIVNQYLYGNPVACQGGGGATAPAPPPQFWLPIFPKNPPLVYFYNLHF